jgi:hypothetical protein
MKEFKMNLDEYLNHQPKASRFTVINRMREKRGEKSLIWDRFKEHSWKLIEEITEDERVKYNQSLNKEN